MRSLGGGEEMPQRAWSLLERNPWLGATHESVLALFLALEIALFSVLGTNFLSAGKPLWVGRGGGGVRVLCPAVTPGVLRRGRVFSSPPLAGAFGGGLVGNLWLV